MTSLRNTVILLSGISLFAVIVTLISTLGGSGHGIGALLAFVIIEALELAICVTLV